MSEYLSAAASAQPIVDLIEAFRSSKAMFVAVSLGVFDHLADAPCGIESLSAALYCDQDALERLLDACTGLNLVTKSSGRYVNTELASRFLCSASSESLSGYILYSDQVSFPLWSHLENAVRHGGPRWKQIYGEDGSIFDQFFRTGTAMRDFLKGMHGFGVLSSPLVASAFDLSPYRHFVDVGGATGHLAIAALERYPEMRATVFDLPRVIDHVRSFVSSVPQHTRIQLSPGDFFDTSSLPEGDLYGLGRILHDWPDAKALSLLTALFERLPSGGGILLAEKLLNEDKTGPVSAQMQSLNMLVCTEGKERTLAEFRTLLESAGFRDVQGVVTGAPLDAIYAQKK